jgi:hypothetical protein
MYLWFICCGTYGFRWGSNLLRGAFEVVGPEIETFVGPEMGTSVASAQKSRDFSAHPFKRPEKLDFPSSKSICPAPYKQQVHW